MTGIDPATLATELVWLVLGTGLALAVTVLASVQHLRTERVPTSALLLGVWGAAALPTGLGGLLLWGWFEKGPDALRLAATSFAALRLAGPLTLAPVALLTMAAAGFFAYRAPERSVRRGLLVGVVGLLVPALVGGAGWFAGDALFSGLRAGAYLGLLLPAALAAIGPRPVMAVAPWVLVVAVGEASHRGLVGLMMMSQVPNVPRARWPAAVAWMQGWVTTHEQVAWVVVAMASVGLLGLATQAPERARRGALLGAVGSACLAATVMAFADAGTARHEALALLCPEEVEGFEPETP